MRDRSLILTGSTGIGAATARLAAAGGAHVVVATADGRSGWELAAEIRAECWIGDLNARGAADSVVAQYLSKFGRVDALFNVAGLSGRRFGDGPVAGQMLEQRVGENGARGAILNMGSVLSEAPGPRHFATHAYAAAKGAVVALTRSMAAYYAVHKIRVNALAPGLVRTPASERAASDRALAGLLEKKQPLTAGMLEAEDVARVALFLLGDEARAVTGEVLAVDAGWSVTSV